MTSAGPLAYRRLGSPDAPPAVVLHGMAENGEEVAPLADLLAPDYDVIVPDLPGHGASPGTPDDLAVARLAAAVADLCESLGIREAAFVGHSLGGAVASALAARAPHLVARLVLLDPGMAFPEEAVGGFAALYDSLTAANFAPTLRQVLPPILFGPNDPQPLVDRVMDEMVGIGLDAFVALGRGIIGFDGLDAIGRVRAPILLVVNETPLAAVENVRGRAADLTVATIENVSHQGLIGDERVHAVVTKFLAE